MTSSHHITVENKCCTPREVRPTELVCGTGRAQGSFLHKTSLLHHKYIPRLTATGTPVPPTFLQVVVLLLSHQEQDFKGSLHIERNRTVPTREACWR